jgi:hypothetical protein
MTSIDTLGQRIAPTAALTSLGSPALMLILAIGYLLASFFVWVLFLFRKAMLIVAAVFAPIAFAGAPARATAGWVRRWVEFTLTMIFSKLVVVLLFTLAVSLVGSPGSGFAAVGNLFSGLAMLVIACFAPWLLFRLVHFVGGDVMAAHHHSVAQSTTQAGSNALAMARTGAANLPGLIDGAAGSRPRIGGAGAGTVGASSTVSAGMPTGADNGRGITSLSDGLPADSAGRPERAAIAQQASPIAVAIRPATAHRSDPACERDDRLPASPRSVVEPRPGLRDDRDR